MTQNVANSVQNNYGSIQRLGTTGNGRVVYQINDGTGTQSLKMSVNARDCDSFEKSYRDILTSAPKLQKYAETNTPAQMEKKQKASKWIVAGTTFLGGAFGLFKSKGNGFWGVMKQLGITLLGAGAGFFGGLFIASKYATPPGATQFAKATQTLSKLDIQPIQE